MKETKHTIEETPETHQDNSIFPSKKRGISFSQLQTNNPKKTGFLVSS